MINTILLAFLVLAFGIFLLTIAVRGTTISKQKLALYVFSSIAVIVLLVAFTGLDKLKSDIARIIHNTRSKPPNEVYTLLFKKPIDGCMSVVNFKDQVIPKIDCCIWMETKICPSELSRVIAAKKYQGITLSRNDSSSFLQPFVTRPSWWNPQQLSDSLTMLRINYNHDNYQILFFSKDSTHVFICDQAL